MEGEGKRRGMGKEMGKGGRWRNREGKGEGR